MSVRVTDVAATAQFQAPDAVRDAIDGLGVRRTCAFLRAAELDDALVRYELDLLSQGDAFKG